MQLSNKLVKVKQSFIKNDVVKCKIILKYTWKRHLLSYCSLTTPISQNEQETLRIAIYK